MEVAKMRLIDADAFIEYLGFNDTQKERDENVGNIVTLEDFDRQPTAYDVDKVVEELEAHFNATDNADMRLAYHHAIKIVK
jgi:hypothetical protein